jgi:hypothetical protein
MGNHKILWTTADKTKERVRETLLGNANWYSKYALNLPKTDAAVLIKGTMEGKFEAIQCKRSNIQNCNKAYNEL